MNSSTNPLDIVIFSVTLAYLPLGTRIPSLLWSLRTPSQHRSIMMSQRKSGGYMHLPPSGMVRNSGSDLYQTLNQPIDEPLHLLSPND